MKYKGLEINLLEKSILILLAVNIYPIIGVLFFGWDYFIVVLLYIIETVIIGLVNVLKMIKAQGKLKFADMKRFGMDAAGKQQALDMEENPSRMKVILVPFFLFHYNFFIVVQTIFVVILSTLFDDRTFNIQDFLNLEFILSLIFLLVSHFYSFYKNYIKNEEYKKTSTIKLMMSPYKRIIIQQITVIAGSFIIMLTNAPIFFLVVLIILKIYFDLRAHLKIHYAL